MELVPCATGGVRDMTEVNESAESRFLAALKVAVAPPSVSSSFDAPPPTPAPGQIWRANWASVVELVLIRNVVGSNVSLVPASLDTDYADEATLVLSEDETSLSVSVAIWTGLERTLPMRILDRFVGRVFSDVTDSHWVFRAIEAERGVLGRLAGNPSDPLCEFRAIIEDSLDELAETALIPEGDNRLGSLIASSTLDMDALSRLLSIPIQQAFNLRRGQSPATGDQAELLAEHLGISVNEVLEANPSLPEGLITCLSDPHRRNQVYQLSILRQIPEPEAWSAAGYGTYALAARQTGEVEEPAWNERLDAYFNGILGRSQ